MNGSQQTADAVGVHVENVGGITETDVTLTPGVNVLTGRNATNRTSFLRALMAGIGSDEVSLRAGAEEGSVDLHVGEDDETYHRKLERQHGRVSTSGSPLLDDATLADSFAFLLESNPGRRAVRRSDQLYDIIMEPVDTAEIEAEIDRLTRDRNRIDERLDELDSLSNRLPELEEERTRLETEIEEVTAELEAKRDALADADAELEATQEQQSELNDRLDELQSVRSDLEDVRFELRTERESLESLREERTEVEAELEDVETDVDGDTDPETLDAELRRLRDHVSDLETDATQLQTIINFNEDLVEGTNESLLASLRTDGDDVTDRLVGGETVVCWTCGTEVEQSEIEETFDQLRELRKEKIQKRNDLQSEISELQSRRDTIREATQRRNRLENQLERIENEIESREERIEDLEDDREELSAEVDRLDEEVSELEPATDNEVLEHHREVNQLEFELDRLEDERDEIGQEIANVEDQLGGRDDLTEQREEIRERLTDLRTRIERIERDAVEEFNDHMETVLDVLEYENLDRVWIERLDRGDETEFELHIVRRTDEGTSFEDTIDHLSESEREVVGLVFCLAGYLVHDVHEDVPFMVLDSLEAIDSDRIAALVDYFESYAEYLVVALLPEDAAALDDDYTRITEI